MSEIHRKIRKSPNEGGWIYAVWSDAAEVLGAHGAAKIHATVDG